MNRDELSKMKKDELIDMVLGLEKELAKSNAAVIKLKAKLTSKVGFDATGQGSKNPYVR